MAPKVKFIREELVQAGLNVVRRKGYTALTAQSLAEELHISTRLPFSPVSGPWRT